MGRAVYRGKFRGAQNRIILNSGFLVILLETHCVSGFNNRKTGCAVFFQVVNSRLIFAC